MRWSGILTIVTEAKAAACIGSVNLCGKAGIGVVTSHIS